MNKTELIQDIAKKTGLKLKDVDAVYKELLETISHTLSKGEKVQLIGFGTFETRKRAARQGRNPQTGKTINIKARTIPAFKPGKALRDRF
jgi:DNA-binding protein HU-beta